FWSWNAMESPFVEREWRYALGLKRPRFVCPVYWEKPMPERPEKGLPPEELRRLHFYCLHGTPISSEPRASSFQDSIRREEKPLIQRCDPATSQHQDSLILGQCLDCGELVCSECGSEKFGMVRHRSKDFCSVDGMRTANRIKYKRRAASRD